jgi:tensin
MNWFKAEPGEEGEAAEATSGAFDTNQLSGWFASASATLAPKLTALQTATAQHVARAQSVAASHVSRAQSVAAEHAPKLREKLSKGVSQASSALKSGAADLETMLGAPSAAAEDEAQGGGASRRRKGEPHHTYVAERVIAMPFPFPAEEAALSRRRNCIDDVTTFLNEAHGNHYMVWNLSERGYDESAFDEQVIVYNFPGHPAPPLGLLYLVCNSVRSWLAADARNVAVVHCLTGRGRTSIVCAAILLWLDPTSDAAGALERVASTQAIAAATLTLPSQRRYFNYFACVTNGIEPATDALRLVDIRLRGAPPFARGEPGAWDDMEDAEKGCAAYFQIVKNGKVVWSSFSAGARAHDPDANPLPRFVTAGDDAEYEHRSGAAHSANILFGDLVIRCRHVSSKGKDPFLFRAAFTTGFIDRDHPTLLLSRSDLDESDALVKSGGSRQGCSIELRFAKVDMANTREAATAAKVIAGALVSSAARGNGSQYL